jgi:hypothetical protein
MASTPHASTIGISKPAGESRLPTDVHVSGFVIYRTEELVIYRTKTDGERQFSAEMPAWP